MNHFESWLAADGPVAVVLVRNLEPVQGEDGVIFPPTFAPPEDAKEKKDYDPYIVDGVGEAATALIDTVGAQANRLEPIFKREPYRSLVPQARVRVGQREVDLLDAGHRAADALVRFSTKGADLGNAFRAIAETGNSVPLAKVAPTSLVFGVWDSRDTGVKIPRLITSTVRAQGVERLSRAAQYFSAFEKDEMEAFAVKQEFLSEQGLRDAPSGRAPGGIIARRGIKQETVLNLIALRSLAGATPEETEALQRYVLGLALAALTGPWDGFLRQGCFLVPTAKEGSRQEVVRRDGTREEIPLSAEGALEFARGAAARFGVGPAWDADFDLKALQVKEKEKAAKKPKKETTKT